MKNVVGKTLENSYAIWTILGTPVFSHTRPGTAEKVYKVHALCEPKNKRYATRAVDLNLHQDDLAALG